MQQRDRKYKKDLIYMKDIVTYNIYIRVPEQENRKKMEKSQYSKS